MSTYKIEAIKYSNYMTSVKFFITMGDMQLNLEVERESFDDLNILPEILCQRINDGIIKSFLK